LIRQRWSGYWDFLFKVCCNCFKLFF